MNTTTKKEAMTNTAMEKEIDEIIINRLQYSRGHRVVGIQSTLLRDDIMDYVYSQLSQIKEEIEKLENNVAGSLAFSEKHSKEEVLSAILNNVTEIIDKHFERKPITLSHMEEKGQEEKHE